MNDAVELEDPISPLALPRGNRSPFAWKRRERFRLATSNVTMLIRCSSGQLAKMALLGEGQLRHSARSVLTPLQLVCCPLQRILTLLMTIRTWAYAAHGFSMPNQGQAKQRGREPERRAFASKHPEC